MASVHILSIRCEVTSNFRAGGTNANNENILSRVTLRIPVNPGVVHAETGRRARVGDLAPLQEAVNLGNVRRVIRARSDDYSVELFLPVSSLQTVWLLEVFEVAEGENPFRADLLKVLDAGGVRVNRGVVVGVQVFESSVGPNMGADPVGTDDPGL